MFVQVKPDQFREQLEGVLFANTVTSPTSRRSAFANFINKQNEFIGSATKLDADAQWFQKTMEVSLTSYFVLFVDVLLLCI